MSYRALASPHFSPAAPMTATKLNFVTLTGGAPS